MSKFAFFSYLMQANWFETLLKGNPLSVQTLELKATHSLVITDVSTDTVLKQGCMEDELCKGHSAMCSEESGFECDVKCCSGDFCNGEGDGEGKLI